MTRKCKCGSPLLTKANTCPPCARIYMGKWRRKRLALGESLHNVYNYTWRTKNPQTYLFQNAKNRAKKKGLVFTLDKVDIIIPEYCPILGLKLELQAGKGTQPNSPSIDRIDSDIGYTKENVQIISWRANHLKSDGTVEELIKLGEYMKHA